MEPPVKKLNTQPVETEQQSDTAKKEKKLVENILTYDVLRLIFKYLSAKDLTNAAYLCRTWRDAANEELAIRRTPEYYLRNYNIAQSQNDINARPLGYELKIKPAFALICVKMQEENEWHTADTHCGSFPNSCNIVQMGGYEVVENYSKTEENNNGIVVSAFLPQMPALSYKVFQIHRFSFKHSTDTDIRSHADKIVTQLLPPDNESKRCMILLANQHGYKFNKLVLKGIQSKYKPGTISLWGGVCVDLKLCDNFDHSTHRCSQDIYWTGMYITSPSLESYSIVLPQSCRLEPQMLEKLEKLRKNIKLKKYSMGFMFACIERVKRKDLEIKVFKKVFPEVPLVGLHGDGEYGLNTLNTKRENELHHAYSTIFLILTYL